MSFLQTLRKGRTLFSGVTVVVALFCALSLVLPLPAEAGGAQKNNRHKVIIQVDGKTQEVETKYTKVHSVLHDAGIKLQHHDEVRSTTPRVTDGTVITVYRAKHVTLEAHGKTHKVVSGMPTVGELLQQHGYHADHYSSDPDPATPVQDGMHIKVETLAQHELRLQEEARLAAQKQEQPPTGPDVIHTEEGYLHFTEHFEMEASAYLPHDGGGDGMTAIGIPARHGTVAVDPDVIALGTRLYIPGYGIAIAADTGGAVYGMTIDLCMESYDEAIAFGRQDVDVYVLAD